MTEDQIAQFYWWAAMALDMDSCEVDSILIEKGIPLTVDTLQECEQALQEAAAPTNPWPLPRGW